MTRRPRSARPSRALSLAVVAGVLGALGIVAVASAGSAGVPGPPPPAGSYRLPLGSLAGIDRGFEQPPEPWAAGHRGVDLLAPAGTEVLSPGAGFVTFSGAVAGRRVVTVTDAAGRRSSVEPLVPAVGVGDLVAAGDLLGTLASDGSHCAPATCLHWGVRLGTDYVDPLTLLPGAGPVVLLPLDAGTR